MPCRASARTTLIRSGGVAFFMLGHTTLGFLILGDTTPTVDFGVLRRVTADALDSIISKR